jgi:hypothetical protein
MQNTQNPVNSFVQLQCMVKVCAPSAMAEANADRHALVVEVVVLWEGAIPKLVPGRATKFEEALPLALALVPFTFAMMIRCSSLETKT